VTSFASWSYRHLPADDREAVFSRVFVRNAAIGSLAGATLLMCTYWFGGWKIRVPLPTIVLRNFAKLDFVPSLFSLLLPIELRSGFHQYVRSGTYCFPGPFWWESMRYLRTAIPAYAILFFLLACSARVVAANLRSVRRRSG
jgi:hypothetical protein